MRTFAVFGIGLMLSNAPAGAQTMAWICNFQGFKEPLTFVWEVGKQKATIIGNAGTAPLYVHGSDRVISFVEFVGSGAVMTSTIIVSNGVAVHSRNSVIGEKLVASQSKGQCQLRD
ncbi:MAG: hypothetical protein O9972_47995 [Burkholderiales bacterium]|nr:hypothetical protein [Burkholderiales bacterium]